MSHSLRIVFCWAVTVLGSLEGSDLTGQLGRPSRWLTLGWAGMLDGQRCTEQFLEDLLNGWHVLPLGLRLGQSPSQQVQAL